MRSWKWSRAINSVLLGLVVVFSFGAAGEICGSFFDTTAAAFGTRFLDNNIDDVQGVLSRFDGSGSVAGPENKLNKPMAVFVVDGQPRSLVGWDISENKQIWKVSVSIQSELTVAGNLVLFASAGDVAAYELSTGQEAWRFKIEEGWDYQGSDVEDELAVVAVGVGGQEAGGYANGQIVGLNANTGSTLWENASGGGLIGDPVIKDTLVFAPWDRQKLVVIDGVTGDEVARIRADDFTINYVDEGIDGIYYGVAATSNVAASLIRFDENSISGTREGSSVFVPNLKPVPGDPGFKRDAFAKPVSGRSAAEKIRFHWGSIGGQQSFVMAGGVYYLHYWRYILAFDALNHQVRWAHRAEDDIESLSVLESGVIGVTSNGLLFFVDAATGSAAELGETNLKVTTAGFDAAGFSATTTQSALAPLDSLKTIIGDKDNRMLPIRSYAAFLMAAHPSAEVTRDLLQVYSDSSTPKGLRDAVVEALKTRTSGAQYLVQALHMRYDFLEQTQPPPMNVVAPALANMSERAAVPGLLSHLMNHETPVAYLVHVADAIGVLGDPSVISSLRQFLILYHADSYFSGHEDALASVAKGLLSFGGESGRALVVEIGADSQTLPELKQQLALVLNPQLAETAEEKNTTGSETTDSSQPSVVAQAEVRPQIQGLPRNLPRQVINETVASNQSLLRPCVQAALGKQPTLQNIRIRFNVTGNSGKAAGLQVLPNNIPELHSCLSAGFKEIVFPQFRNLRQSASYTIRIRGQWREQVFKAAGQPASGVDQDPDAFGGAPASVPMKPIAPKAGSGQTPPPQTEKPSQPTPPTGDPDAF